MSTFDPMSWMDAADDAANAELSKLDADNAVKGGRIIAKVKAAFDAAKADDAATPAEQIARAKALGVKFDQMLAALEGGEQRPSGNRRRDNPTPAPDENSNPQPDPGGSKKPWAGFAQGFGSHK